MVSNFHSNKSSYPSLGSSNYLWDPSYCCLLSGCLYQLWLRLVESWTLIGSLKIFKNRLENSTNPSESEAIKEQLHKYPTNSCSSSCLAFYFPRILRLNFIKHPDKKNNRTDLAKVCKQQATIITKKHQKFLLMCHAQEHLHNHLIKQTLKLFFLKV